MDMNVVKVGMREFRSRLPQYLLASSPVAITRHGETIGFYIPSHHTHPQQADLDALKQATIQLETLLVSHGVTEEQLFSEFRALRKGKKH
jgi:hypothetical protein